MREFRNGLAAVCGGVLLSACAPDAWKSSDPFNNFLNQVSAECYYDALSSTTVGELLQPGGSDNASYFLDVTSRLYFGKITPQDWTLQVTSQLQANATDRGIKCLLNVYQKTNGKPAQ